MADPKDKRTRNFKAFISYRHADNKAEGRQWATWLHQALETYEIPSDLVGKKNERGEVIPERIFPVFRDEEELPVDASLASPIYRALDNSENLVVICSPRAVESQYVASEIAYFKQIGKSDRVLAMMVDGEPNASIDESKHKDGLGADDECFPKPLQVEVDKEGHLTDVRAEPIAADFRILNNKTNQYEEGWTTPAAYRHALKDSGDYSGKEIDKMVSAYKSQLELMKLKVVAGVIGLPLGELTKRDEAYQLEKARRRQRILISVVAVVSILAILASVAGVIAWQQSIKAEGRRKEAVAAQKLAEERRIESDRQKEIAEKRNRELLEEKLVVLGNKVEESEKNSDYVQTIQSLVTSIDIKHELGLPEQAYLTRLKSAYYKNKLLFRVGQESIPDIIKYTSDGKYLVSVNNNQKQLAIISVEDKDLIHTLPLLDSITFGSGLNILRNGKIAIAYEIRERYVEDGDEMFRLKVIWNLIDPVSGQVIDSKILPECSKVKSYAALSSSYGNSKQYFMTSSGSYTDASYSVYRASDCKKVMAFDFKADVVSAEFTRIGGQLSVVATIDHDDENYLYLIDEGAQKKLSRIASGARCYVNDEYIYVSKTNDPEETPYLIFMSDLNTIIPVDETNEFVISDEGKIIFEADKGSLTELVSSDNSIVADLGYSSGREWNFCQSAQKRVVSASEYSVTIHSEGRQQEFEQIRGTRVAALSGNTLATVGEYGNIFFWNISTEQTLMKIIYPAEITYSQVSDSKRYLAIPTDTGMTVYDYESGKVLHLDLPQTGKKMKIDFLEDAQCVAVRFADKFLFVVPAGTEIPPQELFLFDLKSGEKIQELHEPGIYTVTDYRIDFADRKGRKYRLLRGTSWTNDDNNYFDCESYSAHITVGSSIYAVPYDGKNDGKLLKYNLAEGQLINFKDQPFSSKTISAVRFSENKKRILIECFPEYGSGDDNKAYYLYDVDTNTTIVPPQEIFLSSGHYVSDCTLTENELIVGPGYTHRMKVYRLNDFSQICDVTVASDESSFRLYPLQGERLFFYSEYNDSVLVSTSTNSVIKEIDDAKAYDPVTGNYVQADSDTFIIRNLLDESVNYSINTGDYPENFVFSSDSNSLYFTQEDGIYRIAINADSDDLLTKSKAFLKGLEKK